MDIFLWVVVAVTQVGIAFLGIVAIRSDFAQRHFWPIVVAFGVLSLLGLTCAGISAIRASKYSDMVGQLTQQILFEVRGSPDSYIEITPFFHGKENYEKGIAVFPFYNESKYPMINAQVGIVGSLNLGEQNLLDYHRRIGDVLQERGGQLPGLTVQFSKEHDNRIDFSIASRSVYLWEYLYVSWNGKGWVSDYSLRKKVGKDGKEVYVKKLRDDFPFIKKGSRINEERIAEYDAGETAGEGDE